MIRWHCWGTQTPPGATVREHWALLSQTPEAVRLRAQTLEKLAHAPFRAWPGRAAGATNDFAQAFHQMFDDLAAAESFFEAHGNSNRFSELVLAARLTPDRAEFWRTNLRAAFSSWSAQQATELAGEAHGWQLSLPQPPGRVRLVRAGDWTLVGWAAGEPVRFEQLRARLARGELPASRNTNAWLTLLADLPRLPEGVRARVFGAVGALLPGGGLSAERLPAVELTLRARGQTMRLEGELRFTNALSVQLDEWQIPTELVRDPIIGFTAARGLEALFTGWFRELGLPTDSPPNQAFLWVGAAFPVQVLAAAPTTAAEKVLQSAAAVFPARFNAALGAANAGTLELLTNAAGEVALRWTDIPPFVTPFLTVATNGAQTHLVAGLYPNSAPPGAPAPTGLFEHLTRQTNLIYYEWEFTGPRTYSWRASLNILRHFFQKPRLSADTAAVAFLNSLTNHPANTVTELRLADSHRLALVREGPFALSSLELLWLAHWLESPEFPFRLRIPEPPPDTHQ